MQLHIEKMRSIWQGIQNDLIDQAGQVMVITFYPEIAAEQENYDSYFQESTDPSDPNNVESTDFPTITITGIFHTDLYGATVGSDEALLYSSVGRIQMGDAMITARVVDVMDPVTEKTYFEHCQYITVSGYYDRYEVSSVQTRGLSAKYVVDVFLRKWGEK